MLQDPSPSDRPCRFSQWVEIQALTRTLVSPIGCVRALVWYPSCSSRMRERLVRDQGETMGDPRGGPARAVAPEGSNAAPRRPGPLSGRRARPGVSDATPAARSPLAPEAPGLSSADGPLQRLPIGTAAARSSVPAREGPVRSGGPPAGSAPPPPSPLLGEAQPTLRHYGFAVMSVAVAWGLTLAAPALHQLPTSLFFAAVMVTAFHGHLR